MVNDRSARRARHTPASPETAAPDPENDPSILPSKGRQSFGQHAGAFVRELLAVVIGAVIVASLLRGFVGQMFIIPSISMQNTLQIDDRVVV
jgi:signal peptidase I